MTTDNPTLSKPEEKITEVISKNEGINNSSISDKTGYNPTKVNRTIEKLEKKGVVKDTKWKKNRTSYVLEEDVEVYKNYRFERILSYQVIAHVIEFSLLLLLLLYLPSELYFYLVAVFLAGFLPSFLHSVNYVLEEEDLHEVRVKKKNSDNEE